MNLKKLIIEDNLGKELFELLSSHKICKTCYKLQNKERMSGKNCYECHKKYMRARYVPVKNPRKRGRKPKNKNEGT